MNKYYVIFMPDQNAYLPPVAKDCTSLVSLNNAGKWESEEKALEWLKGGNNFKYEYYRIDAIYYRY